MSSDPVIPAAADPPAHVSSARKCPECGAESDGQAVTKSSESLAAMREELAALKKELHAEKNKPAPQPAAPPAPAVPAVVPVKRAKKRKGMLYSKRAE